MEYIVRKPDYKVLITRPNFNASIYNDYRIAEFTSEPSGTTPLTNSTSSNDALLGYSFKESLGTVDDTFSLSLSLETDRSGRTWMDRLRIKDLVFIYEFDQLRFIGSIESMRYSARLGEGKPSRNININGVSLVSLLSTFQLVMDQFLFDSPAFAEAEDQALRSALIMEMLPGQPVAVMLEQIYDRFMALALKTGSANPQGLGVKSIIDKFIDFNSKLSQDVVLKFPITPSIFNAGENNIWDILQNIVVPPVNELFGRLNPITKIYEIVFRQAPFDPLDWKSLPTIELPAVYLSDHDIGFAGNDVFTFYLCTVAGSGMNDHKAMLYGTEGYGSFAKKDTEKWKKYGYKPLIVEYKYFKVEDQTNDTFGTATKMQELSESLYNWYRYNDEFATGSVEVMTVDERTGLKSPRVGYKLKVLDAEFYIEAVEHQLTYGGSMVSNLSLSRGFMYKVDGSLWKQIPNIGVRLNSIGVDSKRSSIK